VTRWASFAKEVYSVRVEFIPIELEISSMREKSLVFAASLFLSATLVLSGCKSSTAPAPAPANTPAQSANPDGTAAPATAPGSTAAAPAPAPEPGAPAAAPAPAPVAAAPPPPPEPVKLTAPSGAAVVVTVTEQLSASKNNVGDGFTGVLAQSVKTAGGGTVFPRGAHVVGTVVAAKGQGKFKGSGALGIQVTSISGRSVSTSAYEKEQKGKGKRTAGMIGGGAGGGALIGGLAGGGKGALIGGLIGAGAGTAGAAFTGNKDVVIASESTITFHLTAPVTITVTPKEAAQAPPPQ
jgi:hypothetical protein